MSNSNARLAKYVFLVATTQGLFSRSQLPAHLDFKLVHEGTLSDLKVLRTSGSVKTHYHLVYYDTTTKCIRTVTKMAMDRHQTLLRPQSTTASTAVQKTYFCMDLTKAPYFAVCRSELNNFFPSSNKSYHREIFH